MTALGIIVAALLVAFAWMWRISYDAGRARQRKLSVLNPGEAILVKLDDLTLMTTPPDFEMIRDPKRRGFIADEEIYRSRARVDFGHAHSNMFKITGVTG